MSLSSPTARRAAAAAALAGAALLAACAPQPAPDPAPRAADAGHVHGLHADAGGRILVATHDGLFEAGDPERIGPRIDLMGFTADGGTLYASGHPDPSTGIPEPAGLLESRDGGATWEQVSRQGESDFHAMAATRGGLVAFDGRLRTTGDGTRWTTVDGGPRPFALAGHPDGGAVLATTEEGVWRSADSGATWKGPDAGPVLLVAAFADPRTAVGVAPDGAVHTSTDAGRTWTPAGDMGTTPAAVAARNTPAGGLEVWVATDGPILHSKDGGRTFVPLGAG